MAAFNEQLYEKLGAEFPKDVMSDRKVPGGKTFTYVVPTAVIRRLNEVTPDWSYDVEFVMSIHKHEDRYRYDKETGERHEYSVDFEEVAVVGTLTMNGVPRSQFGGGDTDGSSLGQALKAAATDAMKKCASLFNVALYIYDDDEPDRSDSHDGTTGRRSNGRQSGQGTGDRKATQGMRNKLRAKAGEMLEIGNQDLAGKLDKWADNEKLTYAHVDAALEQVKAAHEAFNRSAQEAAEQPEPPDSSPPPPIDDDGQQDDLPF